MKEGRIEKNDWKKQFSSFRSVFLQSFRSFFESPKSSEFPRRRSWSVRVQPVIEARRSFSTGTNVVVLSLFEFRESARVFEAPLI